MVATRRPKPPRHNELKRLGIFGGTFDPIHYGHLVCARELAEALLLDLVMFIPASRSPHKPRYRPAPARDRIRMVEIATRGYRGFVVSDMETRRPSISYTADTVCRLRKRLGPSVELWLLVGMDAYLDIPAWKDPATIVRECSLGVACRPGYHRGALGLTPRGRTRFVKTTLVDISSTQIRKQVRDGRSIDFLLPREVEAYIRRHGLYGSGGRA